MNLIKDWIEDSAYTYFNDTQQVDDDLNDGITDEEQIREDLEKKYPEKDHFILIDYIDDRNMGYFHIRVWKLEPNYKKAWDILMDYWNVFPDEEKQEIDMKLKECGL